MNVKHLVSRFAATVVTLLLAFGSLSAPAAGLKCDADVDGDIDNKDLALIAAARNTPASGPDDPRDADDDGMITVTDGRICALRCTLPDCSEPAANRAPVANAGPDQMVFTGSLVTLDGTDSTDADGDPLTFRWSLLERPAGSTAALSDPAAARPTFTADRAGRYVAELVVNDGKVDSAPDTVVVNTEDRNTDPVANAGPDQPGAFVGVEVTLDGSGSTDVDGDTLAFSWAFVSRPAGSTAALSGAGTVSPRFTPDLRGVFVVRLTVNDGRAGTDTDDVVISTENTDRPPVALAGPDQAVEPGQNVCLDGSGSFDPDLDPISAYAWSFTTRPAGSAAVLAGAATATPCFTADRRGDFVVQLIVTANAVASAPDTVVVTTSNVRPVADAGPDQTVTIGDTVSLDGSGSSDANGDALGFNWSFVSRPAGSSATLSGALTPFASFAADVAGPFVVQLIVNDGLLDSLPDTTLITVNALENRPPTAVNDSATTPAGVSVLIDVLGNDSDPDSDPLTITEVSDPAGGTTAIEANKVRFTPDAGFSGVTSFTYVISDGRGGTSSATVTVTVTATNRAPVANAGPDQSVYLGDAIVLAGSGSDPDGDPITYQWSVQSAPPGATVGFTPSATVASPSVTVSATGLYVLRLVVDDGSLDSAPDDVAIAVAALPTLSIDNVSVLEGNSGTTDAVFTVTLSGAIDRVVTVNYATAGGTATAGSDFVATSGTLTFPAGSTAAQTVTVLVNGDTDVEPNETFFVDLSSPVNATIAVGRGTGTILNDDSPTLTLLPANQSLLVGATGNLTVSIPAPAGAGGVEVTLASNDTNVATVPASVTIAAGASSAAFQVTAGTTAGTAQVTATAAGYTSANANVTVTLRGMSLALGSPIVGVGRSVGGTVTLAAAAPAGGVTVNLASSAPGVATVAPASVFIAAGGTSAAFTVSGVALGAATLEATAAGYTPASVGVSVSNQVVNIGVVPTVGPGQSASLPISLSTPAVGDVVITLSIVDPAIATISPLTVTIPNGQVLPPVNPQVTGVALGVTSVTATAAGYAPETRAVTVALTLEFQTLPGTIDIPVGGVQNVTLNLSAPANVGGFTVNLSSDDTAVATVPATAIFAAGQTQVSVPVTGVGPGGTSIRASASGVPEATKAVSVFSLGDVVLNVAALIGKDLQVSGLVRLESPPPAPVDITLSVPAGSGVLLSSNATAAGATTLVIPAVDDGGNRVIYVQGTATGAATVTASAPGYDSTSVVVTVTPSGFAFYAVATDTVAVDAFAANQLYQVWSVRLDDAGALQDWQPTRGGVTFNVPVASSNPAAGTIVTSPLAFTGNTTFVNAEFDPVAPGSTVLAITQPAGFTATSNADNAARTSFTVNLTGSSVLFSGAALTVGRNLQASASVRLQGAPPSPVDITLSVPPGSGVLLSSSATAAGAETLVIPAVADAVNRTFLVQGTALGSVTVTASAPGFTSTTMTANVTPSGFAFYAVATDPLAVDALAANQNYQVWSVRLNEAGVLQDWQPTRGGVTFNVPVASSNPAAGTIVTSPLAFTGNTNFVNAVFDPVAPGSTVIAITQPAGFTATSSADSSGRTSFTVNVTGSSVLFGSATVSVGRNLQVQSSVRLQGVPPAPVDITLSVPAGSGVLLSSNATAAGVETLVIPAVNDASSRTIYVQGTALGSVTVTASAPGFASTTMTANVTPSGFAFYAVSDPTTVDAFAVNQSYQVWSVQLNEAGALVTWQPTRGGVTFNVPVASSNPAAGTIVTSPLAFTGNTNFVNAVFDPVALGSTVVAITQPAGFTATTTATSSARTQFTVNVTGSAVQFSTAGTVRVGRNLQASTSVRLQSPPPAPVNLTLSVPAGSGVLLSTSATAAGVETLVIPAVADAGFRTIYIQGTAIGATTITASAPGYADATQAVVVAPSGFAFYAVPAATVTNDGAAASYQVWSIVLDDAGALQTWQPTRGGVTFEVPVTSSNAAAGTITNSPLSFGPNTSSQNASFTPTGVGSTVVAITQPVGFTATTSASFNARTQFTVDVTSALPVVTLTVPDDTATEAGQTTGTFVLTRTGSTASALAVRVSLTGTASFPTDFNWSPGGSFTGGTIYQFNIPAGQASLTVNVTPTQDNLVEGAETIVLDLSPSGATPAVYTIGAPSSGTITIVDDAPVVTLTVPDNTATEAGQTTGSFVLSRSGGNLGSALLVRIALSGTATFSSDFNWSPGASFLGGALYQFNIPAGQASLAVTVTPALDNLVEGAETIVLDLSPSTATPPVYSIGAPNSGTVTIVDDPPVVTLTATDNTASEAGQTTGTFVLARSGGNLGAGLSVRVTLSGTASFSPDFNWSPGASFLGGALYQFNIPAGQASLTVTVTPALDNLVEGAESIVLDLSPSGVTPAAYDIGSPNSGTITIADDPPVVTLTVTDATASENPLDTGAFVIARSGGNLGAVLSSIRVQISGTATLSTDYTLSSSFGSLGGGIYLISLSSSEASRVVTLTPVNDATPEVDETAIFTLNASTGTPPGYQIGTPDGGTITIVSDEKPSALPSAARGAAPEPSPPVASTASLSSPTAAMTTTATTPTKAELKRQQRNEKARQRAAQKEAKQLLKQSKRTGAATPSGVTAPGPAAGAASAPMPPVATMPVSPASARPPD